MIDDYQWSVMGDREYEETVFKSMIREGKNIGIISEAGCPGVADPGQGLIAIAQDLNADVKPLVGPDSIILALMASGMNGQCFQFTGYLPIDAAERIKTLKELENESAKKQCTQIFIETPYRNNQLTESICKTLKPSTRLCIAADITGSGEFIKTNTIAGWKNNLPDIHKHPAIFLLLA